MTTLSRENIPHFAANVVLVIVYLHTLLLKLLYRLGSKDPVEQGAEMLSRYDKGFLPYQYLLRYGTTTPFSRPSLLVDRIIVRRLVLIDEIVDTLRGKDTIDFHSVRWTRAVEASIISPSDDHQTTINRFLFCKLRSKFDWKTAALLLEEVMQITDDDVTRFLSHYKLLEDTQVSDLELERIIFNDITTHKVKQNGHSVHHS